MCPIVVNVIRHIVTLGFEDNYVAIDNINVTNNSNFGVSILRDCMYDDHARFEFIATNFDPLHPKNNTKTLLLSHLGL